MTIAPSSTPSLDVRYPTYRGIIERSVPHVEARMRSATRVEEPFPHVWVQEVLPGDFYQVLADAWPAEDVFWSERPDVRLDLVPRPPGTSPADPRADQYDRLPSSVREVWDFFILDINRRIV